MFYCESFGFTPSKANGGQPVERLPAAESAAMLHRESNPSADVLAIIARVHPVLRLVA